MGNKNKEKDYIKEKDLGDMPKAISLEALEILIPKTKTNICKIKCNNGGHGTGFFCNIQYGYNLILKVLMTNNHVLNENEISIGKKINFSTNNDKNIYEIEIDKLRKIYTNEKYDITIIEIKENDKLDKISFFDLDERISNDNPNEIFKNAQVYLLHYPKGDEMKCSIGLIKDIEEDNYTIRHLCSSSTGSSGGPIINSINFQVLGIHKGAGKGSKNYNLGTFLKEPLEIFNNKYKNNINENNKIKENNDEAIKINKVNDDVDEITIQYKIDKIGYSKNIRIFGDIFVENNKDKCKIIINENEFDLKSHLNINKSQLNNNIFEIKIKGIKQIINMSYMFKNKEAHENEKESIPLSSLPDISKWNTSKVTNMSYLFSNCSSLLSLPDISKWNTENVTDMREIFCGCSSLLSLPDISKWNTENVTDMSNLFNYCCSLSYLPDISKWNTSKVTSMSGMFGICISLSLLPDISKWNTANVTHMDMMFYMCKSISSLPDLSKWNTSKVTSMSSMFRYCSMLSILPDISKWNTSNVGSMDNMFSNCSSLSSFPDISKWNTETVLFMNSMFSDCSSLTSMPDISKWNIEKIWNMDDMFKGCKKLKIKPKIKKETQITMIIKTNDN